MNKKVLEDEIEVRIRFNEVDSMGIVWHGSYAQYFEDAREAFGRKYDLGYMRMFSEGFYTPLVDLKFSFIQPLTYGDKVKVKITFIETDAAKIIFDYEIRTISDNELRTRGRSVQVFLDKNYSLQWFKPPFFEEWKKKNA